MSEKFEDIMGAYLKGDRLNDSERYNKSVDNIYNKLRPIWLTECRESVWLLKDDYIRDVAKILYLDDQMGGDLDPSTLSTERQNLLGWKQVQTVIEKYKAQDCSLVDTETTKAILSSIIRNKNARDSDRLKAIEMMSNMFSGEHIEGVTFVDDIPSRVDEKGKEETE